MAAELQRLLLEAKSWFGGIMFADLKFALRQLRKAPGFAIAAVALLMALLAVAAAWVPAQRAARVDPMKTLRAE